MRLLRLVDIWVCAEQVGANVDAVYERASSDTIMERIAYASALCFDLFGSRLTRNADSVLHRFASLNRRPLFFLLRVT